MGNGVMAKGPKLPRPFLQIRGLQITGFHDHHVAFLGFEQGAWLKQAVRDFFAYHAVPRALSWAGGGLYGIA